MSKELVKKVRFVQKENSPQECCNTSGRKVNNRVCTVVFRERASYLKLKCAT